MFIELGKRFNSGKMTEAEIMEAHGIIQPFEAAKGKHTYFPGRKIQEWFLQPHINLFIHGANQCLSGDSEIYDPVKGEYLRLDKIDSNFHVLSLDGDKLVIAKALQPFLKGHDVLYEAVLSNGEKIIGTPNHQILSDSGYISLDHAWKQQVSVLSPLLTNSEYSPSVLPQGVCHLKNIILGFQSYCLACFYLYGAQPPSMLTISQDAQTLLNGVLKHISYLAPVPSDDQEHKQEYNHFYLQSDPLSNQDAPTRFLGQFFDTVWNNAYIPSELAFLVYQKLVRDYQKLVQQSIVGFSHQLQSIDKSFQLDNQIPSLESPSVKIEQFRPISTEKQPFYDFHVPGYNNYYYNGIIHHNSGKSAACIVYVGSMCEGWHPAQKHNLEILVDQAIEDWVKRG
jgi:hypothetical protein